VRFETAVGVTCPSCTVEIFSGGKEGGKIYEGQKKAVDDGYFNFQVPSDPIPQQLLLYVLKRD
jgi:hypothetical protein